MSNISPGGWTNWSFDLTPEANQIFEAALDGILGVEYTAMAFSTRPIPGGNYVFLCTAAAITNPPITRLALVYATSTPKPALEDIKILPLDINGEPGGFSSLEAPPSATDQKLFEDALEDIIGVEYTPKAVSSQVVSSATNYQFVAKAVMVMPDLPVFAGLVRIVADGSNPPEVKNIQRILQTGEIGQ